MPSDRKLISVKYYVWWIRVSVRVNSFRDYLSALPLYPPSRPHSAAKSDRTFDGSSPTSVNTFLFRTLAIPFTPLFQCLSDETVKAVGPFYMVSMPGEVKDPTSPHWNVYLTVVDGLRLFFGVHAWLVMTFNYLILWVRVKGQG